MPLSDADEIRNLIASYAHYADVSDAEGYAALYAADGCLVEYDVEIPRSRIPELVNRYRDNMASLAQPQGIRHMQFNTRILSLEAATASALTDLMVVELTPERGWYIAATGQYHDDIVKHESRWLLKRRVVRWYKDLPRNPVAPQDQAMQELIHTMQ